MKKMSRSPDRYSFQKRSYQRKLEKAESPESVQAANDMLELYKEWQQRDLELEESDEWKMNNMSYDLCTTDWILAKVRASKSYAQNLYAALCNNSYIPEDVWGILKNVTWDCTWRYAAGLISDIREDESYIDWYCSGTGFKGIDFTGFVEESYVTPEVEMDIKNIGWLLTERRFVDF